MDVCSICLDEIKDEDRYELLKCPHTYHKSCILKWLQKGHNCPVCRNPITNIFSIETKKYGMKEKNILDIDYLYLKVYDKELNKLKFKILIGNIYNVLVYVNKLNIKYFEGKKIKEKNLLFKDQDWSIMFYKLLQKVHQHFLTYYVE